MRTLMRIRIDTEAGNRAIGEGRLGIIKEVTEKLKAEAAYFFVDHGRRTAGIVFDLQDPSQNPGDRRADLRRSEGRGRAHPGDES